MFKLAIADEVEVPINFTTNNAGRPATFKFKLVCQRLTVQAFDEKVKADPERRQGDFLADVATDWKDQRLVLCDDDQPAPFSLEALAFAFNSVPGLGEVAYQAYRREIEARAKN